MSRIEVRLASLAIAGRGPYLKTMTTTVDAIYEDGKLVLTKPLPLPQHSHVQVTIEAPTDELLDVERRNRIWSELDNDTEGW